MSDNPDYQKLYELAESQAGYFTAGQARTCGFSWERLSTNAKGGRFIRVRHGIYRLRQFPGSAHEDMFVAWLRAGPKAIISHQSALSLYGLSDLMPAEIHVIVPRSSSRRRPGLRQHTHQLAEDEITTREGLPLTTVPRTIADVAAMAVDEAQIMLALQEALVRGLTTDEKLHAQAASRGGRFLQVWRRHLVTRESV